MGYDYKTIEKKWQKYWKDHETFKTDVYDFSKPKFYALDMFPYPSGVGLHVGHPEGYTATDIVSRMKRMQGYNVLHPMGYDSFGLPAEQYAIQTGNNPAIFTKENISFFQHQLEELGFDYDWSKTVYTSDPDFYHWTQWIFKNLYLDGYAKFTEMPVNWCEELGTVLSNDEVIDGKSERGGYPVVRINLKQWVIDQVQFAEELLEGLDRIDWPESTKEIQRNWIGKSVGASIIFKIKDSDKTFTVFTTRADTLYGATYCVLSPEHELVKQIASKEQLPLVEEYIEASSRKSELERTSNKEKTGVFTGAYAINPVNDKAIPIYISDYVLASYGTGAIMAVPAHDSRDYEFAKKFGLEIIQVLEGGDISKEAYEGDGVHINSGFLNGLGKQEAIDKMIDFLKEKGIGEKKINYKFREWIFARQRYWGEPVPVVHMDDGSIHVLDDNELPLILPILDDYKSKNGKAPLENAAEWKQYTTKDGRHGVRETSTMPGSAGSSWYFLRYVDPHNQNIFCDKKLADHWLPVDLYIGGPEHAVGHLIYSRIWTKYLYKKGLISFDEPFQKLVHQGMILGANNIKMGKRYPEFVVNPSDVVRDHGADTLRLYEMFMGPLEASKPWSNQGVEGAHRFIDRVYRAIVEMGIIVDGEVNELDFVYNQTVKKVSEDFESLSFNTAISQMMIFMNEVYRVNKISREQAEGFVKLFYPIAPHIGEEMWNILGHDDTIAFENWPTYDESKLVKSTVKMAVSVNGKLRDTIEVDVDLADDKVQEIALASEAVKRHIEGKSIKKIIVVKNKIVNIVAV